MELTKELTKLSQLTPKAEKCFPKRNTLKPFINGVLIVLKQTGKLILNEDPMILHAQSQVGRGGEIE